MTIKILTFLIFTTLMSCSMAQVVKDKSLAGQWEYSVSIEENNKTLSEHTFTKCLSKDYLDNNSSYNLEQIWDSKKLSCSIKDLKVKNQSTSFNAVCTPKNASNIKEVHIEADYMSEKEKSLISSQYTTFLEDRKKVVYSSIKGIRKGSCK